jgi:RNA polymerase sigma factor (TIGR02999 family)
MSPPEVTRLLVDWTKGDARALDQLTPLVYDELRKLARGYLRRERIDHTLQSTALVHEAWIRLIDQEQVEWKSRSHFFGIAAQMMRRILVDHARSVHAAKRGSGAARLSLDEALGVPDTGGVDLMSLDQALERLSTFDAQQSRIVELRFFAGLSIEETAEALGISPATVKRDWVVARAWLFREMSDRGE